MKVPSIIRKYCLKKIIVKSWPWLFLSYKTPHKIQTTHFPRNPQPS